MANIDKLLLFYAQVDKKARTNTGSIPVSAAISALEGLYKPSTIRKYFVQCVKAGLMRPGKDNNEYYKVSWTKVKERYKDNPALIKTMRACPATLEEFRTKYIQQTIVDKLIAMAYAHCKSRGSTSNIRRRNALISGDCNEVSLRHIAKLTGYSLGTVHKYVGRMPNKSLKVIKTKEKIGPASMYDGLPDDIKEKCYFKFGTNELWMCKCNKYFLA